MTWVSALRTGHVGLNVTDIERSLVFYRDVLGFEVIGEGKEEGQRYAYLGQDGGIVLTLWQQAGAGFDPGRAGLHHLAFEVDGIDRVRTAEAALAAHGADFAYDGVIAHGPAAESGGIFFHDPDGTRLEIYAASGADASTAPSAAPTCGFF